MTAPWAARTRRILAPIVLWALGLGIADAARTLAAGGSWHAAFGVLAFSGMLVLVPGLVAAGVAAGLVDGDGDLARLLPWTARTFWPRDPARRVLAGATALFGIAASGAFVAVEYRLARHIIESMRTPLFAAMASTLVALALGLSLVLVVALARRQVARQLAASSPGRLLSLAVSPPFALLFLALGVAAGLWVARERVRDIVAAVDLVPYGLAAATAGVALGIGVAGLFSPSRPVVTWTVVTVVPVLIVGTFVAVLARTGPQDDVRGACSEEAAVAPLAYRLFKAAADRDGDGQLPFLGEGDCAPGDPTRYAGAVEVADNGIDEDCDGEDLRLGFVAEDAASRWDFPVPDSVRETPWTVVLLTIDALAPAHLSLYGYERPTMPFLEELAAQSAWFPWAYSQGPSTRLAFPSIFTSRFDSQVARPTETRIPLELLSANVTMAEVLQDAGLRTVAVLPTSYFAKWKGLTQGFDTVVSDPAEQYVRPGFHNAASVTDAALEAAAVAPDRPMFLWLHYYDPHGPQTRPPGDDVPDWGPDRADVYDAELVYTDREIRRFVESLRKIRPADRTILIVVGDHGEAFDANHAKRHHGFDLHSVVLHVPLIVSAPFVSPGPIDMPVSSMDLLPTLVNLLGIEGDFRFEGTSLAPQLTGAPSERDRRVYSQFFLPENVAHRKPTLRQAGIRTADLYYFRDFGNNRERLFRYRTDPFELDDLARTMPEAAKALRAALTRWQARVAPKPAAAKPPAPSGKAEEIPLPRPPAPPAPRDE